VSKTDFTNPQICQQPIEFFVTVVERIPSIAKKNKELLQNLIEVIFKLMIEIESDIEESWLKPIEGFKENDEGEEGEDNVNFGKGCIDKIISAVGDEICLPLLSAIVNNTMANETDWRYKNAGLMAFSQVGEYIDDIVNIGNMVPVVLQHLEHPNPKIRFAALHCLGQISDDMTEDFQETYGHQVLPALVKILDDQVPRVSAHCASAITNFMDGASEELVLPHMIELS
jgi:vesicle coat complex subunit